MDDIENKNDRNQSPIQSQESALRIGDGCLTVVVQRQTS